MKGCITYHFKQGLILGAHVRVGMLTLDLVDEMDPGSIFIGAGGNPFDSTMTSWGEVGVGGGVDAGFRIDKIEFRLAWEIFYGMGKFEDTLFYFQLVNGDYTLLTNRIEGKLGFHADWVFPFMGVGLLLYDGNAELEQANVVPPDTYDIDFGAVQIFKILLGVDLLGGKYVWGRISVGFLAETSFELAVGVRFQ